MSTINEVRILATSIRQAAQELEHTADFIRIPKQDELSDLIARINLKGWRIQLCQCLSSDDWYVCLYRGDESMSSGLFPDHVSALINALEKVQNND